MGKTDQGTGMIKPVFRIPTLPEIGLSVAGPAILAIISLFSAGQTSCGDPAKDFMDVITTSAEYEKSGVQVVVCIVDGKGLYEIETIDYDENDPTIPAEADTRFEVIPYFVNFKVKDKNGLEVTKFDQGIELSLLYSKEAYNRIIEAGYLTPRAAFLVREDGAWSGAWEELGGTVIKEFSSEDLLLGSYERILVIKLKALPDPLIGGC